jgi:hypothetical protein
VLQPATVTIGDFLKSVFACFPSFATLGRHPGTPRTLDSARRRRGLGLAFLARYYSTAFAPADWSAVKYSVVMTAAVGFISGRTLKIGTDFSRAGSIL